MSELDVARLIVGAGFLAAAAAADLRARKVGDRLWVAMGTVGLVLFVVEFWLDPVNPVVALVLVPTAVLLYDPLLGQEFRTEEGWRFPLGSLAAYGLAVAATGFAILDLGNGRDPTALRRFTEYLTAPVVMLVFRGMYEVHLLKGGADAKAMIVIAALAPRYPSLAPFPVIALDPRLLDALRVLFPFAFLVLLNAALVFAFAPLAFLTYNASRGNVELPEALVGYKVRLDRVPDYVWFMDQIEDGEHVVVYFPMRRQDRPAILRDLRRAGFKEAWVTPQLPFMVPLAVAYVASFLLGNPLMGLLQALMPGR